MEIIYYNETDTHSTLLQAPFDMACGWFGGQYDTTLVVELFEPATSDITQYYLPQHPQDWLEGLPQQRRNGILNRFIQYCQNVSLSNSHPISFSS